MLVTRDSEGEGTLPVDTTVQSERCANCTADATVTFGVTAYCDPCKTATILATFVAWPNERPPWIGGIGARHEDGYHYCDMCHASWRRPPGDPIHERCPWCAARLADLERWQAETDRQRLADYVTRLRDGDIACLAAALHLADRIEGGRRQVIHALLGQKPARHLRAVQ